MPRDSEESLRPLREHLPSPTAENSTNIRAASASRRTPRQPPGRLTSPLRASPHLRPSSRLRRVFRPTFRPTWRSERPLFEPQTRFQDSEKPCWHALDSPRSHSVSPSANFRPTFELRRALQQTCDNSSQEPEETINKSPSIRIQALREYLQQTSTRPPSSEEPFNRVSACFRTLVSLSFCSYSLESSEELLCEHFAKLRDPKGPSTNRSPMGFLSPTTSPRCGQRPTPRLPHSAVLRLQAFSTS